jgi:hypothetical protein
MGRLPQSNAPTHKLAREDSEPGLDYRCQTLQMRNPRKLAMIAAALLIVGISLHERYHLTRYGHLAPFGLHSDFVVRKSDIGIPGISKLYEARLTNYGIAPVKVTACDFLSDASEHGTMVAFLVERWNPRSRGWETVVAYDSPSSCGPSPLAIAQAHLISKRLWPGQSISTGDEATAARDAFAIGDKARFVVLDDYTGSHRAAFPTAAFAIDEHPTNYDVPSRLRH